MPEGDTTIHVSESTWRRLHEKKGPGDSHDDILQDVLDKYDNMDNTNTETEAGHNTGSRSGMETDSDTDSNGHGTTTRETNQDN